MKLKLFGAALGACVLAAGAASAQDGNWYAGVSVGSADVKDVDVEYYDVGGTFGGTGARDSARGSYQIKRAAAFGGTLGYDFGMVRTDLELAYSRNDISSLTVESINGAPVTLTPTMAADVCDWLEASGCSVSGNRISYSGGKVRQAAAMANVWFDLPFAERFNPYVGGGVGVNGFEADGEGEAKFAWQVGAGAAFDLTPNMALTADFRHRRSNKTEIAFDSTSGFNVGAIRTNTLSVGLRFKF